jgi:cytidylate kinase
MPSFGFVIVLSGPVGSGKTTVAHALGADGASRFSTRGVLTKYAAARGQVADRRSLQLLGERLDIETAGTWVIEACERDVKEAAVVVIDSVRIAEQLAAVKSRWEMVHVHLTAPLAVLAARYEERRRAAPELELESFEAVRAHRVEASIDQLAAMADLSLDTKTHGPTEVVHRVRGLIAIARQHPRGRG